MWATTDDLRESLRYEPRADEAVAAASHILWSLSGRKYSGSHNVVEFYDARNGFGWNRQLAALALLPTPSGVVPCTNCGFPHRMRLRHQPVQRVLSVEINGEVVPPSEWALLNHSTLGFPFSRLPCSAVCARVSYIWGVNPPAGGRAACVKLAEQFLFAWAEDDSCRLPTRVTNITRQGVSWTVLDPQDFLNDGRTGIYEIDLFLKSVNPDHARRPARVFSPDIARAQTVVQELAPPVVALGASDLGLVSAGELAWYVTPFALWPLVPYTPVAIVNGVTYGSDHFTTNTDGSCTLVLSATETTTLVDGDTFLVRYHPTGGGSDVTIVSGVVRFVQA